ncbi:hypothetical protein [Nonomuraea aurantiaca]|jgi:hypothetical protein|uniref:hypothetical protein n=1 Tax=Nonomuraea aurantiaca TaxID=2878562 RepID=UPI001CD96CF7|nr:hypothetical protein [Nonomuraea aurantiaca]MCA2221115.1 hypothetical protein [Nonomuraea aurantiaca]
MKNIAIGLVSALVGGTLLISGAGAASATTKAPTVDIRDISPNPVVVRAGSETEAFFKVDASSDVDSVRLSVEPVDPRFRTLRAKDVNKVESWRFSVPFNENDQDGKWKAVAEGVKDGKVVDTDTAFFAVEIQKGKAETRISRFSADPSKVRKGRTIWFSGRLQVNDDDRWKGVRGERVSIFYKANGSSGWKWVASDRTGWNGKIEAQTRAYKSGVFKAVYAGDDELEGATSGTDYVRVVPRWFR